jgi:hypothetical protein
MAALCNSEIKPLFCRVQKKRAGMEPGVGDATVDCAAMAAVGAWRRRTAAVREAWRRGQDGGGWNLVQWMRRRTAQQWRRLAPGGVEPRSCARRGAGDITADGGWRRSGNDRRPAVQSRQPWRGFVRGQARRRRRRRCRRRVQGCVYGHTAAVTHGCDLRKK